MKLVRRINAPVFAFFLVVVAGWVFFLYFGDWWWLPAAILAGIIAGDLAEAVVEAKAPVETKGKGVNKK